ncbi:tumor susceptibility gene 101 protein (TSG101) domain containing protein [Entamoeba histolytica KU27]|uniref:Tumor susceptibility gene 101 protein (TSG101) domain containing protein n=1 Tax=Entamoeba histolytica KU27 TaxID=885311 RepID=M2QJW3_ENTHI|nr:tumor susceptibility gene 101 protein (TSG101) domain containing protein [Entamoeba histolytica KU27]
MQPINNEKNINILIKKNYNNFDSVEQDIRSIHVKYPQFRVDTWTSRISGKQLLVLTGFLPILFNGRKFGIPLLIGFPYDYPLSPPEIICNISEGMEIVKKHPEVDENGVIRKVGDEWNPSSDLLMVLESLANSFGRYPPVRQAQNSHLTTPQGYPITASTSSIQPNPHNNFRNSSCSLTSSQFVNSSSPYCQQRITSLQQQYQPNSYGQFIINKPPYSQEMSSFNPSLQPSSNYNYPNHLTSINPSAQPQYQPFNTTLFQSSVPADVVQNTSFPSLNSSFSGPQQQMYYNSFPNTTTSTNPITTYPLQSQEQNVQVNGCIKKPGDDPYLANYNPITKVNPPPFLSMPNHYMIQPEVENKLTSGCLTDEEKIQKEEESEEILHEEEERRKKENEIIQKKKLQKKINEINKAISEISCWIENNSCEEIDPQKILLQKKTSGERNKMKSISQCMAVDDCIEILNDATKNKVISIEDALEQLKKITSIQFHAKYCITE